MGVLPPNHPVGQAWRAVNRSVFGRADGIITLGPYAASYIRDHYLPESQWGKVHVVPNWAGGGDLRPVPKETNPFALEHGLTDKFVLLMSGNLGRFQEFDSLLKAARLLEGTNVLFLFIGEGGAKPDLIDAARRQPNVRVMDFVPEALFPYSLGSADLMLVTLKPGAERAVVPCRTYSYLASGRAILAVMRAHADTAQELTRFDCGEVVDYDPARIAERVLWLRDHPERVRELGANARKAFEEHFTLDKISDLYYRLLASPRTPEASS